MVAVQGKGASGGIAYGRLRFYRRSVSSTPEMSVLSPTEEQDRFRTARARAKEELYDLQKRAANEAGADAGLLFEVHGMMLEDPDYTEAIETAIRQGKSAEAAVTAAGERMAAMFSAMEDAYMQARAADVRDISARLISALTGAGTPDIPDSGNVILVADDLTPSETMQLDKRRILGFVTFSGSVQGHTAILARTVGIPAVVAAGEFSARSDGRMAWIDGESGEVYIDPDERTAAEMRTRRDALATRRAGLEAYRGRPTRTADGRPIRLYCNISGPEDLAAVQNADGGGVGLYRTEFLYLGAADFPDEETQFNAYRKVIEGMGGKPVILRTMDVGADKKADYFHLAEEENPALGVRGVRLSLAHPDVFKTQLRAIYRAAAYGNAAIMIPMICSPWEVREVRRICTMAVQELRKSGVAYGEHLPIGIMVETPAAVMVSDLLAKEADFFSIGTNDLLQYTLACDRQNPALGRYYDPHHRALLRMIAQTVENAHAAGIWAGICGELAADTTLTARFLAIGVDEFSVSPPSVLSVRKAIAEAQPEAALRV